VVILGSPEDMVREVVVVEVMNNCGMHSKILLEDSYCNRQHHSICLKCDVMDDLNKSVVNFEDMLGRGAEGGEE
jgi:hypothetical protein